MLSLGFIIDEDADGRKWNVNQLLLVDDTTLAGDSAKSLRQLVDGFRRMFIRRKFSH